jgi:hypothetical protein
MVTCSYDALNDLTHEVAEAIVKTTGLPVETFNLFNLNDALTRYLDDYGVQWEDTVSGDTTLAGLFAEGARIQELDGDDFNELLEIVMENAEARGYRIDGAWLRMTDDDGCARKADLRVGAS